MFYLPFPQVEQEPTARAAAVAALQEELQALVGDDGPASLERRYELHRAMSWRVLEAGTSRGQEHAEQAASIARRLGDELRLAAALHEWGRIFTLEHGDVAGDDVHPTREECRAAQALHEQALDIRERLLGPEHPDVAESLLLIVSPGRLWSPLEPYAAMAERAAQICERALGADHERTWIALECHANCLRMIGQYERGLVVEQRLFDLYTRHFGAEDLNHTTNAASQLAWTHMMLGNHAEAERLTRLVHANRERMLGARSMPTLSEVLAISELRRAQGDSAGADAEIADARAALEAELGPEHPTTLGFLMALAGHAAGRGDSETARELYEQILGAYERNGAPAVELGHALQGLLTICWQHGELAEAQALFERLLASEIITTPGVLNGLLSLLAALPFVREDPTAIERWYEQLLEAVELAYGGEDPNTAMVCFATVRWLLDNEHVEQALARMQRVLASISEPFEGSELLETLRRFDEPLSEQGDYAALRRLYAQALPPFTRLDGADGPLTAAVQSRLSMLQG